MNKTLSELIKNNTELANKIVELECYLNDINNLMWNTWGVKDRDFGRKEGEKIMEILNKWASVDNKQNS